MNRLKSKTMFFMYTHHLQAHIFLNKLIISDLVMSRVVQQPSQSLTVIIAISLLFTLKIVKS